MVTSRDRNTHTRSTLTQASSRRGLIHASWMHSNPASQVKPVARKRSIPFHRPVPKERDFPLPKKGIMPQHGSGHEHPLAFVDSMCPGSNEYSANTVAFRRSSGGISEDSTTQATDAQAAWASWSRNSARDAINGVQHSSSQRLSSGDVVANFVVQELRRYASNEASPPDWVMELALATQNNGIEQYISVEKVDDGDVEDNGDENEEDNGDDDDSDERKLEEVDRYRSQWSPAPEDALSKAEAEGGDSSASSIIKRAFIRRLSKSSASVPPLQRQTSIPMNHMAFFDANKWQRDTMKRGSEGYDGFVVFVGLFIVLLVESIWTFDPTVFSCVALSEAFLILLLVGAACGLFTIFSITVLRIKVQRLLARDSIAMHSYLSHVKEERRSSQLNRLVRRWNEPVDYRYDRQRRAASLTFEWYHGARDARDRRWNPARPRRLVTLASLMFVAMIGTSIAALAVFLSDAKGTEWGMWSAIGISAAFLFPWLFIALSLIRPPGLERHEGNPFTGLG